MVVMSQVLDEVAGCRCAGWTGQAIIVVLTMLGSRDEMFHKGLDRSATLPAAALSYLTGCTRLQPPIFVEPKVRGSYRNRPRYQVGRKAEEK